MGGQREPDPALPSFVSAADPNDNQAGPARLQVNMLLTIATTKIIAAITSNPLMIFLLKVPLR